MEGKFSLKEFIAGGGKESWFKSWGYGWRSIVTILAVMFIFVTIYRAYFVKNQTQTQKLNVWPFSFSTITYAPQQQQKQEIKKRPWWLPIPFVEVYGFSETSGVGNSRTGMGGRAGAKLEF